MAHLNSLLRSCSVFLLLFGVLALGSAAQDQTTGGIEGTVTDSSAAAVPAITVTVTNGTLTKTAETNEKGEYKVLELPPGSYTVSITLPGFQDFKSEKVQVIAGQMSLMDATMVPAGQASSINVEGSTVGQVETETSQI